jgi:FHA domain
VEGPYIRIEETGVIIPLAGTVTTIGRGGAVDVHLSDPSVSRLHAEIVRHGPYAYVADLGLSRNGTRVNGRLVARRVLEDGDVLSFGAARCRVGGIPKEDIAAEVEMRRSASPELTRRELDVLTSLCRPALSDEAFVAPGTAREIATDLVVTEAAVKQHLLRLYQKFRIPEGPNRRVRLANEVIALGLVRPLPPTGRPEPARMPGPAAPPAGRVEPSAPSRPDVARPGRDAAGQAGGARVGTRQEDVPAGRGIADRLVS